MNVVHTDSLSRRFGQRWAYAHIDIQLNAGEKLLLFGANGSGKSTLLRTVSTLLPPTQGTIRLFGSQTAGDTFQSRRRIGFLSHHVGLYEDLSAIDNLMVFARLFGQPIQRKRAQDLLEQVGLEYRSEPISQYSAGMRKRASLALVLLKNPELILLDEPFSALDPEGVEALARFVRESTASIILTSHQIERAAALCDRAIMLENGLIRWRGNATDAWKAWQQSQQGLNQ
ncbi:MAG: heme ABC exporter ATP-binding protein CcmA [Myxococcota bacterium]